MIVSCLVIISRPVSVVLHALLSPQSFFRAIPIRTVLPPHPCSSQTSSEGNLMCRLLAIQFALLSIIPFSGILLLRWVWTSPTANCLWHSALHKWNSNCAFISGLQAWLIRYTTAPIVVTASLGVFLLLMMTFSFRYVTNGSWKSQLSAFRSACQRQYYMG